MSTDELAIGGTAAQAARKTDDERINYVKLASVGILHMGQYFPAAFTGIALPAIFRQEGLALESFWLLMAVPRIPSALKWLMAIVVDNTGNPRIGYRKSWLIPCTAIGAALYVSLSFLSPSIATLYVIVAIVFVKNIVMAAYDISADGYAAEAMNPVERAVGAPIVVYLAITGGVIGASLMSGVETFGWSPMMVAASLMLVAAAAPTILRKEPPPPEDSRKRRERGESASLIKTLKRRDSWFSLPYVFAFGFVGSFQGGLTAVFLVDKGLSLTEIGTLLPLATLLGMGTVTTITPLLIRTIGMKRAAQTNLFTLPVSAYLYYYITTVDELPGYMALLALFIAIAVSTHIWELVVHTSRFRWVSRSQAATDYSAQSSLWNLGILCAGIVVGFVAGGLGWTIFLVGGVGLSFTMVVIYVTTYDRVEAMVVARERYESDLLNAPLPGAAQPVPAQAE